MHIQNKLYNFNPYQHQYRKNLVTGQNTVTQPVYVYYQPQLTYSNNQLSGGILTNPYVYYPVQPQKIFSYKPEELIYANNESNQFEEYLFNKEDYSRLIEYMDCQYNKNNYPIIGKYASTPEFKELAKNKNFNNITGFEKLTDILAGLAEQQQKAAQLLHSPTYRPVAIPDMNSIYAGFDILEAIGNINKFFNSKLSDDLKQYILNETDNFNNLYWVSVNLSYLDKDNPNIKNLSRSSFAVL